MFAPLLGADWAEKQDAKSRYERQKASSTAFHSIEQVFRWIALLVLPFAERTLAKGYYFLYMGQEESNTPVLVRPFRSS
jgi:hypothetical protein